MWDKAEKIRVNVDIVGVHLCEWGHLSQWTKIAHRMKKVMRAVFILESVKIKKNRNLPSFLENYFCRLIISILTTLWLKGSCHAIFNAVYSVMSYSLQPHGLQHARLSSPSLPPGVDSNSCPFNRWCHPTISSSVTTFSSCHQPFPA